MLGLGHRLGFVAQPATVAFSPLSISGLKLWLDASQISGLNDGDALTTWSDSSGLGNDATQAAGTKKPLYKTAIQNGLPVVRFDGVDDVLKTPIFDQFTAKRGTIFVVSKSAHTTSYRIGLNTYTGAGIGFQFIYTKSGTAYKWFSNPGDFASLVYDPSVFDLQTINRTGDTAMAFRRNGALETTWAITNNQPAARVLEVGAWDGSSHLPGDIALVLMYNSSLSSGDVGLVESWINARYLLY